MAFQSKNTLPLVSTTGFDVAPVVVADESDHNTPVNAGTGDWILGSALKKARKILVTIPCGAISGSPTELKVSLFGSATDANGSSGAIITATSTTFTSPAADTILECEIDLAYVTDLTKYYSMGVSLVGGGSTTLLVGTCSRFLEPLHQA